MTQACAIVVERLADGTYRASCDLFPDCAAVAVTEADARAAVETAIGRIMQTRLASDENPIDTLFQQLRHEGRKAFIPFLTAGDPNIAATVSLTRELANRGASLIELGFPYSDPIADGPVIQASYTRALARGLRLEEMFGGIRAIRQAVAAPLVGMVSYTLIHRRGLAAFLDQSRSAGLSGLIVPDLPLEEADEVAPLAGDRGLKLIQLITPTTPRERAVRIARTSTGFLYYVSVTGITGERDELPAELLDQLHWLRGQTALPLCVGFGISKPEHVRMLREAADGIIVGSALVRRLEQVGNRPLADVQRDMGELAQALADALNPREL